MDMTREEWLKFKKILSEFKIPYTTHYDDDNKYVDIFIAVTDYFNNEKKEV